MRSCLPAVNELRIIGLVWRHLESSPGERPRVDDLARALGRSGRRLRREWRNRGHESLRALITYGCLTYGSTLIRSGVKCEAAARLAGFRSYGSFSRDTRRYGVRRPSEFRQQSCLQFAVPEIESDLRLLDTEITSCRAERALSLRRCRDGRRFRDVSWDLLWEPPGPFSS